MSLWTAHSEHALSEDVPAPPDAVRDFYVDLDSVKLVHPLIVSVESLERSETPDGYRQTYRVVDRIPLGPFTKEITYQACLHVRHSGYVLTEADQSPGVRLRGMVSFEPIQEPIVGTRLTERIRISAPRLLAPITRREGVKAHRKMLAGIREHFESARATEG
ncbi:SRPBCC family protein [Mycobacterium ahvazicum]|uniref:SRPBCC family protein n=1 Tax=Mycobacterium ahvazicum TaxID=1964395 RepID=A0A2K4Y418_9MYCO|nr:SRPBCC family protein [Mycobacterium ahvazicum]SOX51526.1 SRPBCC family protein [Mycobacterium ahvazicum]